MLKDPTNRYATKLMATTLKIIKADNALRSVFHRRHVIKTDRLRAGYERLKKLKANAMQLENNEESEISENEDANDTDEYVTY